MSTYRVKNWRKFQHYKDRNPPWIKLHFEMLSSADWVMLDDSSRVLAIACMLIASRSEGEVDCCERGLDYLKRVAYLNHKPDVKPLINCGFLQRASDCKHMLADARPETETETYKEETEKETEKPRDDDSFWKTESLESEFKAFKKMRRSIKAPLNEVAESRLISKLERMKSDGVDIREALNRSIENCWKGVFEPGDNNGQGKRQGNGTDKRYGETPADRNKAAEERYLRERGEAVVATHD